MITKTGTVEVKFGEEPNVKTFSQGYSFSAYETADDVLAALQNEAGVTELIDRLNKQIEATQRVNARNKINAEQAAPEKAFEKQVKAFMKARELNGKPVSEEQARKVVQLMLDSE